jgi:hypothetical protein
MQVNRQSNPWPSVVMLVGLALFCLTVPRYWRKQVDLADVPPKPAAPLSHAPRISIESALVFPPFGVYGTQEPYGIGGTGNHRTGHPSMFALGNDLLSLWASPTIEELVAARAGTANLNTSTVAWPIFEPTADSQDSESADAAAVEDSATVAGPLSEATFDRIGRAMVAYAPAELLPRLTAQAARAYQLWSTKPLASNDESALESASRVRVLGPDDRLAVISEDDERAPVIVPEDEGLELDSEPDPWCVPEILFYQLQRLARHPHSKGWAEQTIADLHALTERDALSGDDVQTILAELCGSAQEAMSMAEETDDDRLRVELLRAHWGLARRLDRWTVVHEIRVAALAGDRVAARGSLGTYFDGLPNRPATSTDELTLDLETYEETRDPQLGRQIVLKKRSLEASGDSLDRALADAVEQHYRNANVRVAISAEMLNRYVGQERSEVRPLRDHINGASIRGQSHMQSSSRVQLDPATGRWDVGVRSQGTIQANAMADGGQAQFRSQTATDFSARKRIVVDSEGVLMQPASIDVDSHSRLMGVTTDADWVPFVRSYARGRAVQEYRARQPRAKMEIESKVAAEAANTLDQETKEAVERVEKQIRDRVTDRLAEYGVKVTPVELTTTHERVVARLRVASDEQAGSHTPRPRALSDSLASAQIHETALTNAAVSLELDGRRYSATELADLFYKKFPQAEERSIDEEHRRAVFQFTKRDAVKFHIENGRLEVTLSLASVELDGRRMRNFVVHAFYVPAVHGLEAELVRDGSLGVEGRLSSSDRARLHNVFNSVLPPERTIPMVRLDDTNDPRLAGLMITQLVMEDGWLGVAVGPAENARVAERSRSLR